jgi:hypothetical protein
MTIATEILNQLGGNKFLAMTGSKNLIASNNGLRMNLSQNKSGAKWFSVKLNSLDLYELDFFTADKNFNLTSKAAFKNVYADQLQDIFTEVTGLYTKL